MKKILLFIIAFFTAFIVKAEGLEFVSITPDFEENPSIIRNNPLENERFNLTFLDSNLEAKYKVVIKNTDEDDITLDDVVLNKPTAEFFEFSFDGVQKSDVIKVGETKELTVSVKTNDLSKKSLKENFNLKLKYTENESE